MAISTLLSWFSQHQDTVPTVMHRMHMMDDGGVPAWTGDFATYLNAAAHATFAESEERKVHDGTAAEQATLLQVTVNRYKYPMHAALHKIKRCRARAGEPKPYDIGLTLIATRGNQVIVFVAFDVGATQDVVAQGRRERRKPQAGVDGCALFDGENRVVHGLAHG